MEEKRLLGASLRSLRKSRRITLQSLSQQTGLSIGYLSNLERNLSSPTLDNMQKICEVLGTSIGDLLQRSTEQSVVVRREDRAVSNDPELQIDIERIDFGGDSPLLEWITIQPSSGFNGLFWRHEFDEMGLIISGQLRASIDDSEYQLRPGDAVMVKAHSKHALFNDSHTEPCISCWFRLCTDKHKRKNLSQR